MSGASSTIRSPIWRRLCGGRLTVRAKAWKRSWVWRVWYLGRRGNPKATECKRSCPDTGNHCKTKYYPDYEASKPALPYGGKANIAHLSASSIMARNRCLRSCCLISRQSTSRQFQPPSIIASVGSRIAAMAALA